MNITYNASRAELIDKITGYSALVMLVFSLMFLLSAATFLVSAETAHYLKLVERAVAALAVLFVAIGILPLVFKKLKSRPKRSSNPPESFINDAAKQAFAQSWGITLLLLMAFDAFVPDHSGALQTEFILELTKAVLLGTFAVTFFYLNRSDHTDVPDGGSA